MIRLTDRTQTTHPGILFFPTCVTTRMTTKHFSSSLDALPTEPESNMCHEDDLHGSKDEKRRKLDIT